MAWTYNTEHTASWPMLHGIHATLHDCMPADVISVRMFWPHYWDLMRYQTACASMALQHIATRGSAHRVQDSGIESMWSRHEGLGESSTGGSSSSSTNPSLLRLHWLACRSKLTPLWRTKSWTPFVGQMLLGSLSGYALLVLSHSPSSSALLHHFSRSTLHLTLNSQRVADRVHVIGRMVK